MKKYIYLIEARTEQGELSYKIGITKNDPLKRIKQLQTGNSAELKLIDSYQSEYATMIESTLHRSYSTEHIKGEWFDLDTDKIESFQKECSKLEKNFKLIQEDNSWYNSLKNKYIY